jgi:hypothetical protein
VLGAYFPKIYTVKSLQCSRLTEANNYLSV